MLQILFEAELLACRGGAPEFFYAFLSSISSFNFCTLLMTVNLVTQLSLLVTV
jgi:hypothetical protein